MSEFIHRREVRQSGRHHPGPDDGDDQIKGYAWPRHGRGSRPRNRRSPRRDLGQPLRSDVDSPREGSHCRNGTKTLGEKLKERFGDALRQAPETSDMLTFHVSESRLKEVLGFLKTRRRPGIFGLTM